MYAHNFVGRQNMMMQSAPLSLLLLTLWTILSLCRGFTINEKYPHESAEQFVQRIVENSDVTVFSKSYCPYCRAAKSLLQEYTTSSQHHSRSGGETRRRQLLTQTIVELDLMPEEDGIEVQRVLEYMTGQRTVPNVFIDSVPIGGNSDIQYLAETGELDDRLDAVLEAKLDNEDL